MAQLSGSYDTNSEVPNDRYDTSSKVSDVGHHHLSLGPVKLELAAGGLILLEKPLALASKPHASLGFERGTKAPLPT